jgi:hypothetical protein
MTQSAFDPFSREPNYKQSAVRVERTPRVTRLAARAARLGTGDSGPGTRRPTWLHGRRGVLVGSARGSTGVRRVLEDPEPETADARESTIASAEARARDLR